MTTRNSLLGVGGLLMLVTLATPGCATKKFVRQQTGTVEQRVNELDKKQSEAVASLDTKMQQNVSRVEERAMTAENKANDAARAAQQAQGTATEATQMARNATDLAQQTQSGLSEVRTAMQGIDRYRLVSSEEIMFRFDQAQLSKDAQAKLDQFVQSAKGMDRFIVEVEGFTDRTGPADYNLALSRRRADAVVRYLVQNQVPLRRIHMIGLGEWNSAFANGSSVQHASMQTGQQTPPAGEQAASEQAGEAKLKPKDMRRVVVKIWAPETTLAASNNSPQSQQPQVQPQAEQPQSQPGTTPQQPQPQSPSRP